MKRNIVSIVILTFSAVYGVELIFLGMLRDLTSRYKMCLLLIVSVFTDSSNKIVTRIHLIIAQQL